MIPNLFRKEPIPNTIPKEMESIIQKYSQSKNKEIFLRKSYEYLTKKYNIKRLYVIIKFPELFKQRVESLWNRKGYIHCISLNYLLRIMLIRSGLFSEHDIELKISNTWFIALHQYLRVKINQKKYVNVDPWTHTFGIEFGDYGHGFHSGSIFPKRHLSNDLF